MPCARPPRPPPPLVSPHTNNPHQGFTDSGMLAAYDAMDLTADNDWVLEPFFGYSCDDIDTPGGPGGGHLCVPEEFGSLTSQWALFCPVTCEPRHVHPRARPRLRLAERTHSHPPRCSPIRSPPHTLPTVPHTHSRDP